MSSEPAYSVFDRRLLFIAGGQCGNYFWSNSVNIYDIENAKEYDIKDVALKTIPA